MTVNATSSLKDCFCSAHSKLLFYDTLLQTLAKMAPVSTRRLRRPISASTRLTAQDLPSNLETNHRLQAPLGLHR